MSSQTGWETRVRQLAAERDAVILAHNYQRPEIQDVADHVGDSLALARLAASESARTIVLAGVYFMAETAKILSPQRTVLIPDANAGCSLADSITAEQLREWKREHPGAVVVAYVNTSAEVKAESDVCCTSANAADIVAAIPAGRDVLFLPDQFLGAHVRRVTGRENLHVWMGECHVHAGISPQDLRRKVAAGMSSSCPTSSSARTSAASPAARTCTSGWASAMCTPASPRRTCAVRSRPGCPLPARPVPRRARPPRHRPREPARLDGRVPCARRHLPAGPAP